MEIATLRKTGKAASHAAGEVRAVHTVNQLPTGDAGIPGAAAVAKLAAVREAWEGREAEFARTLNSHADNIARAAVKYTQNEQKAEADLHGIGMAPPVEKIPTPKGLIP
ncbi:hypothetical protein CVV72_40980 (plasmid) [Amycolatopsis sp. TNS106]|nr:hypothetical protein CVV72_40980 [Amycolatopsis sp. TNS106]